MLAHKAEQDTALPRAEQVGRVDIHVPRGGLDQHLMPAPGQPAICRFHRHDARLVEVATVPENSYTQAASVHRQAR